MVSLRSETEALAHAAGYQPAGADRVGVLQQLGVLSRAVTSASAVAARLGIEDVVGFLPVIIDRRLSRLRASESRRSPPAGWSGRRAAGHREPGRGRDDTRARSDERGVHRHRPGGLPDYVRVPLIRMAQLYADARPRVQPGRRRVRPLGRADQRARPFSWTSWR